MLFETIINSISRPAIIDDLLSVSGFRSFLTLESPFESVVRIVDMLTVRDYYQMLLSVQYLLKFRLFD